MKTVRLLWSRYLVMGVVVASLLLMACSSGGGAEPPNVNTPTPERVAVTNTPTPEKGTVVNTPTREQGTAVNTPTPTPKSAPAQQASPSPAAAVGEGIKVNVKNNIFPKEIRVKVGSRVVFVVTNEEKEQKHSFELPDFDLYRDVGPLETVRIEWLVPDKKGTWDMGCYLTEPSDAHDGMVGDLIIE